MHEEKAIGWLVDDGDDELLRRCQQGQETALDLLVRRYQQRVFHLVWRVLGDAALAEEATAQTLVKIWSRCGQWRGQSAAGTWIYRIAVRTALDVQRSQTRWWRRWSRSVPIAGHDGRPGPEEEASRREQLQEREQRVQAALWQLPETVWWSGTAATLAAAATLLLGTAVVWWTDGWPTAAAPGPQAVVLTPADHARGLDDLAILMAQPPVPALERAQSTWLAVLVEACEGDL